MIKLDRPNVTCDHSDTNHMSQLPCNEHKVYILYCLQIYSNPRSFDRNKSYVCVCVCVFVNNARFYVGVASGKSGGSFQNWQCSLWPFLAAAVANVEPRQKDNSFPHKTEMHDWQKLHSLKKALVGRTITTMKLCFVLLFLEEREHPLSWEIQ